MPKFVIAVNARGDKQRIPAAWLDHPVLGAGFSLPPSARAGGKKAKAPAEVNAGTTPPETPDAGDEKE